MKTKNITYLLGAGASYNSCPVWKEQGEKMIELSRKFLNIPNLTFENPKPDTLNEKQNILWDIGYFGNKALEYGTVDTYAKKLLINKASNELQRLKLAVSIFFTLWESSIDGIKNRNGELYKNIDSRYISLLASIIESNNKDPKLKENVRFVTWNYDLQLERAFKAFCLDDSDWDYVSSNLSFRVNGKNNSELEVCHLNGYNGFCYTSYIEEVEFLERSQSQNIEEILDEISFLYKSMSQYSIRINNHINYAWENNSLSERTRKEAYSIFKRTDILIIIGYSFPPFNKEIDKLLFEQLKGRNTKIYYQDPNASEDLLKIYTDGLDTEIHLVRDKKEHFFLPPEF